MLIFSRIIRVFEFLINLKFFQSAAHKIVFLNTKSKLFCHHAGPRSRRYAFIVGELRNRRVIPDRRIVPVLLEGELSAIAR